MFLRKRNEKKTREEQKKTLCYFELKPIKTKAIGVVLTNEQPRKRGTKEIKKTL